VNRRRRGGPRRSEVVLTATAALTSATMLFACLVVPVRATARPLRQGSAPEAATAKTLSRTACRPEPPHGVPHIAKPGAGAQPAPSLVPAGEPYGNAGAGRRTADRCDPRTSCDARGCSLARGQPGPDALT
jgi:hypothetical protein